MSTQIVCDVCGRVCVRYVLVNVVTPLDRGSYGTPREGVRHLCLPTSGGDVGCAQYLGQAFSWIGEQQRERAR